MHEHESSSINDPLQFRCRLRSRLRQPRIINEPRTIKRQRSSRPSRQRNRLRTSLSGYRDHGASYGDPIDRTLSCALARAVQLPVNGPCNADRGTVSRDRRAYNVDINIT